MALVSRNEAANTGAEASITRWYSPPLPESCGITTTSTPTKPSIAASQRSHCIVSRKNRPAPIMMKIGVVKPIAVMSASGIFGSALNHKTSPSVCTAPRVNCPRTLRGQQAASPRCHTSGSSTRKPNR